MRATVAALTAILVALAAAPVAHADTTGIFRTGDATQLVGDNWLLSESSAVTVGSTTTINATDTATGTDSSSVDACSTFAFCDEFGALSLDTTKWVAVDNTIGNTNEDQCDLASQAGESGGYLTETFETGTFTCPGVPTGAPTGSFFSCSGGTCSSHFAGAVVHARDFAFKYGTVEVNMKTAGDHTSFVWPGPWLLGHDCQHPQYIVAGADAPGCSWPNIGSEEIDMPDLPSGTSAPRWNEIYQGNPSGLFCDTTAPDASDAFNTYKAVWNSSTITWYRNGVQQCQETNHVVGPMFPIFQTAYSGNDSQTPTRPTSYIDWIHITADGPNVIVKPSISGSTVHGSVLTADHGSWTGAPTGYTYQWLRCGSTGVACSNISTATSSTYTTVAGDVGHTIEVLVIASNASGSVQIGSAVTGAIS